jgi:hypothetical protein
MQFGWRSRLMRVLVICLGTITDSPAIEIGKVFERPDPWGPATGTQLSSVRDRAYLLTVISKLLLTSTTLCWRRRFVSVAE